MDYDIKKGNYANIEGEGLRNIAELAFGNVEIKGDMVCASFGALESLEAKIVSKTTISINTKMRTDVSSDIANETIKRYNTFLEQVTGFSSKERRSRLQKKAKEGKL